MSQNGTNDSQTPKTEPSKPPHRRLVVMFDGTGNTRESMTNVSRMFEAIDDSHPESYKSFGSDSEDCPLSSRVASSKFIRCRKCNQPMLKPAKYEGDDRKAYFRAGVPCGSCHQCVVEPELQPVQLVKYIIGVGTNYRGVLGYVTGQMLGYGLSDKIKEGYTWLCENYQSEEDDVFVFGFSRGAFAARSLVSLLHTCKGVLKKTDDSHDDELMNKWKSRKLKEAIKIAYTYYENYEKTADGKMNPNVLNRDFELSPQEHGDAIKLRPVPVKVKMLGVWDTVGALGVRMPTDVPVISNSPLSRQHYQFHDQSLKRIVQNAYHALALDEYRKDFEPTLWESQDPGNVEVKQVWFVGSHCNVGGGADLDDNVDPDDLWQYSYVWMQKHAQKHGLRFFWSYESPATRQANSHLRTRRVSLREPEPSYANCGLGLYCKFVERVPFNRKTDPKLAMLHWSVVERLKVSRHDPEVQHHDLGGKKWKPYRPGSLLTSENYCSHEFLETVVPEDSTVEIAPGQVDLKSTAEGAVTKWHIETDDVTLKCTQWQLPLSKPEQQLPSSEPEQQLPLSTKQLEPLKKKEEKKVK